MSDKLSSVIKKYNLSTTQALHGAVEVQVKKDVLLDLMKDLKNDAEMDFLSCVTGLDWVEDYEIVYHLNSCKTGDKMVIKVRLDKNSPEVDTVTSVWSTANWQEREIFDLYGIKFKRHPNLKRLLLADDHPGHPMRKDWPIGYDEEFVLRESNRIH